MRTYKQISNDRGLIWSLAFTLYLVLGIILQYAVWVQSSVLMYLIAAVIGCIIIALAWNLIEQLICFVFWIVGKREHESINALGLVIGIFVTIALIGLNAVFGIAVVDIPISTLNKYFQVMMPQASLWEWIKANWLVCLYPFAVMKALEMTKESWNARKTAS